MALLIDQHDELLAKGYEAVPVHKFTTNDYYHALVSKHYTFDDHDRERSGLIVQEWLKTTEGVFVSENSAAIDWTRSFSIGYDSAYVYTVTAYMKPKIVAFWKLKFR